MALQLLKITKESFAKLIQDKIASNTQPVIGVTPKGTSYAFSQLSSASDLCLNYDVTILPPKKYLMPQVETLLSYKPKDATSYKAEVDESKRVIVGVHPYDLAGIQILDKAFLDDKADANYAARRNATTIIGMYPTKEFKYRFAASADNSDPSETADAMLCDLGDSYGVEIFTDKGKDFFGAAAAEDAGVEAQIAEKKNAVADGQKLPLDTSEIPALLAKTYESKVWADRGDKCYSCGSCVLVCPTCYCFDVREELELSLERGERVRVWDGCMLEDFAKVAGDHNFRKKQGERFAHRIMRKGIYLVEKFGKFGCVGCGRCAKACTADIANPVEILEDLKKESSS